MLDSLVKAAEKIAQLLEYRERRKQIGFKTFVDPMYTSLRLVHVDYVAMLNRCLGALESKDDYQQVLKAFTQDRVANEPLRRELAARVLIFCQQPPANTSDQFFRSVLGYLQLPKYTDYTHAQHGLRVHGDERIRNVFRLSGSIDIYWAMVDAWNAVDAENLVSTHIREPDRESIVMLISTMLADLNARWERVVRSYAVAQLEAHH